MVDDVLGNWDEARVVALVDAAISQGKALDTQHHNGNTLLHMCAYLGNADKVQQLLSAGSNPHVLNYAGRAPKDLVLENGHQNILHTLLRAEAFGKHALSRQRSEHEVERLYPAEESVSKRPKSTENPAQEAITDWNMSPGGMFENYMDWTEDQRQYHLQKLVEDLDSEQVHLQQELDKLGNYRLQVKEHMSELHTFLRKREHELCCEIFDALEAEKQVRKELETITIQVADAKQYVDKACKQTWWRGTVYLREGLLKLRYRPVYLKLTGDKLMLFDIRQGARAAKPSVEIDLETLLRVDEDDPATRGRKRNFPHMTFHVAAKENWGTGERQKFQVCFPEDEQAAQQQGTYSADGAKNSLENGYESLCAALRETLQGRCGRIGKRFASNDIISEVEAQQPIQSPAELQISASLPTVLPSKDSLNLTSPDTSSCGGPSTGRASIAACSSHTTGESVALSPQSPFVDGTFSVSGSPAWAGLSTENQSLDDSMMSNDSFIFQMDENKKSLTSSSGSDSDDLPPPPPAATSMTHTLGRRGQQIADLNLLSVSVGDEPKLHMPIQIPDTLDGTGVPAPPTPHMPHMAGFNLDASMAKIRAPSWNITPSGGFRKTLSSGQLTPRRTQSTNTNFRLSEGDCPVDAEGFFSEDTELQRPLLPRTRHIPTLRARLQELRSERSCVERKLLDQIAARESAMECLHYLQSLRTILEDPPSRPTRELAMTSIPHLLEHIRRSASLEQEQTKALESCLSSALSNHRVRLGQPPAALKTEYTRVWLALETMWNVEQQGFEAVEKLSQTLVVREDTRRRLRQEQKQADVIVASPPSELYEITL